VAHFSDSEPSRVDGISASVAVRMTGPVGMAGFRYAAGHQVPLILSWHTDFLGYAEHFREIAFGAAFCAWRLRLGWSVSEFLELTDRSALTEAELRDQTRRAGLRATADYPPSRYLALLTAAYEAARIGRRGLRSG
jgi:1,2-diacylglycerol 3-alpha-glucosyltransferase